MRKTCTPEFRRTVLQLYPGLGSDPSLWRLMRRLLFSTKIDPEAKLPIIDRVALASDEGKPEKVPQRNYSGLAFLERFRREVMPELTWEDHHWLEGKARMAKVHWSPELRDALDSEIQLLGSGGNRVYFETGEPFTRRAAIREAAAAREAAEDRTAIVGEWKPARPLLQCLHDLPTNRFSKLLANLPAAVEAARSTLDGASLKHQLDVLATIRDQPKQFYAFSPKGQTVRIFPSNAGVAMLTREVRHALCRGWWEFDLRQSQLAICARLWRVRRVEEYLRGGGRIWRDMAEHYGLPLDDSFKSAVKDALYSVLYGSSRRNIAEQLDQGLVIHSAWGAVEWDAEDIGGQQFLAHDLVRSMLRARGRRKGEVRRAGGTTTVFGDRLQWERGTDRRSADRSLRSVLAQEAQAMELWLLLPILDMARSTNEFSIVLWQHDGFSVAFTDRSKAKRWVGRFHEAVARKAAEQDIVTELEATEL